MPLGPSPAAFAFGHIQWDRLNSLRLTAQETALLRMAETNPIDYTLADSRDASMYARVLLKLLAEASAAQPEAGAAALLGDNPTEEQVMVALEEDPLGVVVHYALSKLHEIITTLNAGTSGVTVAAVFYVGKEGILVDQWKALLRILQKGGKGDPWAQKCAALCLAQILIVSCPSQRTSNNAVKDKDGKTRPISYASAMEPLDAVTGWIVSQLKNQTGLLVGLCIPALTALMEATETRRLFSQSGGVKYLSRQLRVGSKGSSASTEIGQSSVQQLYELAFAMWHMTYELNPCYPVRCDFAKDGNAISALVDLVSVAPREKVVRVALASLVNCATCTDDESPAPAGQPKYDGKHFLGEMIACGLMKSIDNLKDRQFTDPDIIMDVDILHKLLAENYREMSRWEVYKNEVESGHLQWGSTHTEAFFKENARMMEGPDGDFQIVKMLIALLSSKDEDVAAIACYDLGEFVRHYPNGRSIAKRLGAKDIVMPLIEHENVELQRHALQCVSKMMVQNWEYVT